MQKIAMSGVDLDCFNPESCGASSGCRERLSHSPEPVLIQCSRSEFSLSERDCRGRLCPPPMRIGSVDLRPSFPWHLGRGLAAGMAQLDSDGYLRPAPNSLQRPPDGGFGLIVPQ